MAQLPANIERVIAGVVKASMRPDGFSIDEITTKCLLRIDRKGGLPAAMVRCAARKLVFERVRAQVRKPLPHNVSAGLLRNLPDDVRVEFERLPRAIAVEEGQKARHVPTIYASPDDWEAASNLRFKKAKQTRRGGNDAIDIARMLRSLGAANLAEILDVEEDEE